MAWRALAKNKLFSFINIGGLAVGPGDAGSAGGEPAE